MLSYQSLQTWEVFKISASPMALKAAGMNKEIIAAHSSIAVSGNPLSGLVQKSSPKVMIVELQLGPMKTAPLLNKYY